MYLFALIQSNLPSGALGTKQGKENIKVQKRGTQAKKERELTTKGFEKIGTQRKE